MTPGQAWKVFAAWGKMLDGSFLLCSTYRSHGSWGRNLISSSTFLLESLLTSSMCQTQLSFSPLHIALTTTLWSKLGWMKGTLWDSQLWGGENSVSQYSFSPVKAMSHWLPQHQFISGDGTMKESSPDRVWRYRVAGSSLKTIRRTTYPSVFPTVVQE